MVLTIGLLPARLSLLSIWKRHFGLEETFCLSIKLFIFLQAKDIMSRYRTGVLENSAKMVLLFHLIDESVRTGDKILVFRLVLFFKTFRIKLSLDYIIF